MQSQNQSQEQIMNEALNGFRNSLFNGIVKGNPYFTKAINDPNFINNLYNPNMTPEEIIANIKMTPDNNTQNSRKEPDIKPSLNRSEDTIREVLRKEPVQVLRSSSIPQNDPVIKKLVFNFDLDLSISKLKDAVFSMVLLTMEKDNVDWSGRAGYDVSLPSAPGYNIIDASKRYMTGTRVEKIEKYIYEKILKDEDTFNIFLNKLYGQLIEE